MAINDGQLLTVREVAERLRLHPITVRRLISSGRLPAVRIGRAVRVREADLAKVAEPAEAPRTKLPYRWPPTREIEQRKRTGEELRRLRESTAVYHADVISVKPTAEELANQRQRMAARKRHRKPFDEMRKLRDEMEPMDISTADLVRLARSAREWMYEDNDD